ncbi:MAG TPA: hypothetical protein VL137_16430 [Polyangiaceae bacterium]|nr:hypothetical protein [Polyangiaceae bacterium]
MSNTNDFQLKGDFHAGQVAGAVTLGPLETVYQEIFAEVLADGVITREERRDLDRTAEKLGLDPMRLAKLEQAMIAAFESSNRIRVVERHSEIPPASLTPLQLQGQGEGAATVLRARVAQLEARIAELEADLAEARSQINVDVDFGSLSAEAIGDDDSEALLRRTQRNPGHAEAYHRLFDIYAAQGALDRQHWVAQALVALGDANPKERELFERHRQQTLPSPTAGITAKAWREALTHPEEEPLTGGVFSVVAPAVLLGRVTVLRRLGQLRPPNAVNLQDPAKATLTAVRAVGWAAAVMGLPVPQLYVEKDREHAFELTPGMPPHTVIGRGALAGRNPLQHAFFAGRHLTGYRQEHFIRQLYGAIPDLEDIFLAAVLIGNPGLPLAENIRHRVEPVVRAIEPLLDPAQLDALRSHILRFAAEGGRTNLQRWSASAEKTACRAGLVLCGDLPTALEILQETDPNRDELPQDLIAYSVSNAHHGLRAELGIAR